MTFLGSLFQCLATQCEGFFYLYIQPDFQFLHLLPLALSLSPQRVWLVFGFSSSFL